MKSTITFLALLGTVFLNAQLQDPDICIEYFAVNGSYSYGGHTYFTYDNNNAQTSRAGVDTITGDSLYKIDTKHISPTQREVVDYRPDPNTGKLVKKSKYEYEEDANGTLLKSITYDWDNGTWKIQDYSTRYVYTYVGNELTECLTERYTAGNWLPVNKKVYTHNGTANVRIDFYAWNSGWGRYQRRDQRISPLDNKTILEDVYAVDPATNVATLSEYNTYEATSPALVDPAHPNPYLMHFEDNPGVSTKDIYDQNGNIQLFETKTHVNSNDSNMVITRRYNDTTSRYELFQRNLRVTDQKGESTLGVTQEWKNGVWATLYGFSSANMYNGNKLTERDQHQFNSMTNQFDKYFKSVYKFTRPIGLVELDFGIAIMPNPASDFVEITFGETKFSNFQMMDLQGRVVLKNPLQADLNRIDISEIPGGSYLLLFTNEQGERYQHQQVIVK